MSRVRVLAQCSLRCSVEVGFSDGMNDRIVIIGGSAYFQGCKSFVAAAHAPLCLLRAAGFGLRQ